MPDTPSLSQHSQDTLKASLWSALLLCIFFLFIYHETVWSIVSIWIRSETFTHGFLILPISLWLAWTNRDNLRGVKPRPAPWVALAIVMPGLVWLLARELNVLVVEQLAMVSMLILAVWSVIGHRLTRILAFPLFFLFFAVPIGEALVPPMMEFTATSTVWMIKQTGIPVFREGMYFSLPSGNWSVVEACSGVRYIIASITLGVLYAYLTYHSLWRRLLFVLASLLVPVVANSVRAYIIVMLGHLSSMKLATGVDHLIYGWVFFGFVMFLLFWLGSLFREDLGNDSIERCLPERAHRATGQVVTSASFVYMAAMALLLAVIWPLLSKSIQLSQGQRYHPISLPPAKGAWEVRSEPSWQWRPESAVDGEGSAYYSFNGHILGLFVQHPLGRADDGEVVGSSKRFVVKKGEMRVRGRGQENVEIGNATFTVEQALVIGEGNRFLAWSWYRIGGIHTSNDFLGKFEETRASLGGRPAHTFRIILVSPLVDSEASTRELMRDFLEQHGNLLEDALDDAAGFGR